MDFQKLLLVFVACYVEIIGDILEVLKKWNNIFESLQLCQKTNQHQNIKLNTNEIGLGSVWVWD